MEIFDSNESQVDNIEKDGKEKDKENINVSTMDWYFYIVIMIRMN